LRNVNNAERDAMDAAVLARHVMAGRIGERIREPLTGEQTKGAEADGEVVWS
jgi:hypothetical protein